MNVSPEFMVRRQHPQDAEDLALDFMETEVGRHDWSNNWPQFKARGDVRRRVQEWLDNIRVTGDPDAIIAHLDKLAVERSGSWF